MLLQNLQDRLVEVGLWDAYSEIVVNAKDDYIHARVGVDNTGMVFAVFIDEYSRYNEEKIYDLIIKFLFAGYVIPGVEEFINEEFLDCCHPYESVEVLTESYNKLHKIVCKELWLLL